MRYIFQFLAMLVFCAFWFVSAPVYLVSDLFQMIDHKFARFLDDLFSCKGGD